MTIDELVVSIILDPKGLQAGAKQAVAAANTMAAGVVAAAEKAEKGQSAANDETAANWRNFVLIINQGNQKVAKGHAETAKAAKGSALSVEKLVRSTLLLYGALTGSRSLLDFAKNIVSTDAAVGRLARNLDQTPERISALAMASQRMGGSFEGALGAMQGFSDAVQELRTTGNSSIMQPLAQLEAAGGKAISIGRDTHRTMLEVADDLKALRDKGEDQLADYLARQITQDPGFANLLQKGRTAVEAAEAESKRLGVITKRDAETAEKAQTSWRTLSQAATGFGREIVTDLSPAITAIIGRMNAWLEVNGDWLRQKIDEYIGRFFDWVRDNRGTIEKVATECGTLVKAAGDIAIAFASQSPMMQALETFGAVLLGSNVLGAIGRVSAAITALGSIPIPVVLAAVVAADGAAQWQAAKDTTKTLQEADPTKNDVVVDPESGYATKVAPGAGNQVTGSGPVDPRGDGGSFWGWIKSKFGIGGGSNMDDHRVRDAILSTAENTKKLVDNADGVDASGGGGVAYPHFSAAASYVGRVLNRFHPGGHGRGVAPGGGGGRNYADTPDGGGHAGAVKGSKGDRAMQAMRYLVEQKGYTPEGAAIAVGNAMQESDVTPNGRPGDPNTPGGSHYMFQWNNGRNNDTVNGRRARYERWLRENHRDPNDYRSPLDYFDVERRQRSGLEAQWHQQHDLRNAGRLGHLFEGYGDNSEGTRVQNARDLLDKWNQGRRATPTAQAPVPAGTSEKAVTDAEVFAARQRIINGSKDPKDRALVDRYKAEQNTLSAPTPPAKPSVATAPWTSDREKQFGHPNALSDLEQTGRLDAAHQKLADAMNGLTPAPKTIADFLHATARATVAINAHERAYHRAERHRVENLGSHPAMRASREMHRALAGSRSFHHTSIDRSVTSDTQVHGGIHIRTAATDARGIAADIQEHLRRGQGVVQGQSALV